MSSISIKRLSDQDGQSDKSAAAGTGTHQDRYSPPAGTSNVRRSRTEIEQRPPASPPVSRCTSFCHFFYNSEDGTIFRHSPCSLLFLGVFYILFLLFFFGLYYAAIHAYRAFEEKYCDVPVHDKRRVGWNA